MRIAAEDRSANASTRNRILPKHTNMVSREDLYELAWSVPMIKVAEKFSVSGSYMARVYSALNVPRPAPGYWTNWKPERRRLARYYPKPCRVIHCSGRKTTIHCRLRSVPSQSHPHRRNLESAA